MTPSQLQPGQKWGHATITAVSSVRLPQGEKRPDLGGPWVRIRLWTKERVVVTCSLPSRELSPNGPKGSWRAKGKATRAHREASAATFAGLVRLLGLTEPWPAATVSLAFYFPDLRRRDADNARASTKAYIDGLRDGGLIRDDSTDCLRDGGATFDVDRQYPRVELTIERVDE